MIRPNGYILWEGSSKLDGQPIVVIATMNSSNVKTGNMIQTWILRSDVNPVEAVNTGDDISICGDCPHRKQADGSRSCYVNVGQAPNSVYKAYKAGKYPHYEYTTHGNVFKGRSIRFGAYGDPALIPLWLVNVLIMMSESPHTGYTHQWARFPEFAGIFMASCDNEFDRYYAHTLGYKTFSVIAKNSSSPKYAKQCPATIHNSQSVCATCKLCDGAKRDIFVTAHGSGAKYVVAA